MVFVMRKIYVKTDRINLALARKNKTQKWLAERIGITEIYLSMMMTRKRYVSPFVRDRLMLIIRGVEWDELFEFAENKN